MYISDNFNKLYVFETIKYSFNINVFGKYSARFARSANHKKILHNFTY